MPQTKRTGRPPAAKRELIVPLDDPAVSCAEYFKNVFGLDKDSAELSWRVPFQEIIEGIQTVGGIARLSSIDRKTVYRKKIPVGNISAFAFVIDTWRGTARPLVRHSNPMHPLNLGQRLKNPDGFSHGVLDVVGACQVWFEKGGRVVKTTLMRPPTDTEPASPLIAKMDAESQKRRRNWKRKSKISAAENPSWLSEDEARENQRLARLGQTYFYRPKDRVTVKMICSRFRIPRREFYRWKLGLLSWERGLLNAALSGKLFKEQVPTGDGDWLHSESVDFTSDGELDESLGWKEPESV